MRRALFAVIGTVTGLVVLLSFKTHPLATSAALPSAVATGPAGGSTTPTTTSPGAGDGVGASAAPSATATPTGGASSGTYTGAAADTRYGPVQVQITVSGGKVTAAQAVEYPQDNPRDAEINSYAVPQLNSEATSAGTANIDTVSGATYTSEGYLQSLQSALDQAGL